ncbi:MAG: Leupeptin-inactivating enzyme 1 precursor [Acidobacteriota bacterium]
MQRRMLALLFSFALLLNPLGLLAQGSGQAGLDPETLAKIRREANENSQIMKTLHVLSDIHGPRLTGSPSLKAAGEWAMRQMTSWGFDNGHLEPWEFGHPGWTNERQTAHIISPVREPLVAEVLAWTPGTNGDVRSTVHLLTPPNNPTEEELQKFFAAEKANVTGRIVLVGKHTAIPVNFNPPAKRLDDAQAKARFSGAGPAGPPAMNRPPAPVQTPGEPRKLNPREVGERIDAFLVENRAAVRVNDAAMEQRRIRAFNNRSFDVAKAVPTVILSNEDYGRITRILAGGTPVELEFNIVNRLFPEGRTAYNVIAEIPGSDLKEEVVMLGGHLDSWHAATGATDNAIGCATMMEAARIIKALGLKPRRTIRVALWSGEEQGLLGSLAYVRDHFGSFESQKPDFSRFAGYFNIDMGTGKARGMSVFGPPEGAEILRTALEPFSDYGFVGAGATRARNLGGSDHTAFNQAGLPGISVGQDPVEYTTVTWHTNLDTYERIVEDDTKKSAAIIAAAVFLLATRDSQLPRFAADAMPALPPARP